MPNANKDNKNNNNNAKLLDGPSETDDTQVPVFAGNSLNHPRIISYDSISKESGLTDVTFGVLNGNTSKRESVSRKSSKNNHHQHQHQHQHQHNNHGHRTHTANRPPLETLTEQDYSKSTEDAFMPKNKNINGNIQTGEAAAAAAIAMADDATLNKARNGNGHGNGNTTTATNTVNNTNTHSRIVSPLDSNFNSSGGYYTSHNDDRDMFEINPLKDNMYQQATHQTTTTMTTMTATTVMTDMTMVKHRNEESMINNPTNNNDVAIVNEDEQGGANHMNKADQEYEAKMEQAKMLRELNCEYQVHLAWPHWGSADVTVPPSSLGSIQTSVRRKGAD